MSEIGKGYVLQNVQMHEMQRQKKCKCTKFYKIFSANFRKKLPEVTAVFYLSAYRTAAAATP